MIRFRCRCGRLLEAPQSAAGGDVQCPNCGWLQSIPELHELDALTEDGIFRFADAPGGEARQWQQTTRGVRPIDIPSQADPEGVDRHQTLEEILRVGVGPAEPDRERPPRFDPETGEAVREFEFAEEPAWKQRAQARPGSLAESIPLADSGAAAQPAVPPPLPEPPPTLAYAAGRADYPRLVAGETPIPLVVRDVYWHTIPMELLLHPANLLVLVFVFGTHLIIQGLCVLTLLGALPLVVLAGWIWLMLLAHYVNVIDETGPERRDELPSVMRNMSMSDDFLRPLGVLLLAFAICLGPAAFVCYQQVAWLLDALIYGVPASGLAAMPSGPRLPFGLLLAMAGFIFFPATLLTATSSGTYLNLAPHRVFGVIRAAPLKYVISLIALALAVVAYCLALGVMGYITLAAARYITLSSRSLLIAALVAYPALFAAVYFAHWFSWLLGKIHQDHHEAFGWVWQRHISRRQDAIKQLERQKAAQIMAEREDIARRAHEQVQSRFAARP